MLDAHSLDAVDFNGDGHLEWWRNDGAGNFVMHEPSSATDDRDAENLKRGQLYRYQSNAKIYVCPTDDSVVTGTDLSRSRSYAMNSYLCRRSRNQSE